MSATFKTIIAAVAAALILAPAGFAHGASEGADQAGAEQVSSRVSYADLDTSTLAGGRTLLIRIKGAARRVCDTAVPHSPLHVRSQIVCRRTTIEHAVRQLNIGTLTAAWGGKAQTAALASRD